MSNMKQINQQAENKINFEFFLCSNNKGYRNVDLETLKEKEEKQGFKGERRTIEKTSQGWEVTEKKTMFDNMNM